MRSYCNSPPIGKTEKGRYSPHLPDFRKAHPSFGGAGGGYHPHHLSDFREAHPSFGGAGGGSNILCLPHIIYLQNAENTLNY
ncbi:hypothetical protein [Hoylesella oralis]|uniref:hypothetical protein n=1 Tax=Hoylesella oralis TaxID=28134 RepID=UPI0028E23714|nr:hypothetical protein [Hoylesella oralis]